MSQNMRVYCVLADPEPHQTSFIHRVYKMAIDTLKLNENEVRTLDLYRSSFTQLPSLNDYDFPIPGGSLADQAREGLYKEEILRCQSTIEWCTHLLLFTPLDWISPAPILIGWWEKVFGEGWAFSPNQIFDKGFMSGKRAMMVVVTPQTQNFYGKEAINVTVEELMYNMTFRCFARCGFTALRTQAFFGLGTASPQLQVDMLNAWSERVRDLRTREVIEYVLIPEETGNRFTESTTDKVTNHKILTNLGDYELMVKKDAYALDYS